MVQSEEQAPLRPPKAANPALEVVLVLARGKATVLGVFLLVTAVVAVGAVYTPQTYKVESSLIVRMGREYIYRPEVGGAENSHTPSLSEIVNSEVEILASRDLAELVVGELGVDKLYPDLLGPDIDPQLAREKAVLRFREATVVRHVLDSSVIKVSYEHEDPRLAAEAVNLLVERFKDKHVEVFGEERSNGLDEQFAARRAELAQAEDALAEFKRASGLFDLDKQRGVLLEQRMHLEDELQKCEPAPVEARTEVAAVVRPEPAAASVRSSHLWPDENAVLPPALDGREHDSAQDAPPADRVLEQASFRLLELQLEEHDLLKNYNPDSRRVQSVRSELELVQNFLNQAKAQAGTVDENRHAVLAAQLETLDRRIADLYQQEKTLHQLERELTAAESAAQTIRAHVEEARISEELDREKRVNLRVIEKASSAVAPSGLSRSLKVALGAFVGLVAGVALVVVQDLFRQR